MLFVHNVFVSNNIVCYTDTKHVQMLKIVVLLYDMTEYIGDRSKSLKESEAVFNSLRIVIYRLDSGNSDIIKRLYFQISYLTSHS